MKFIISRTSHWGNKDDPPCVEAKWDKRTSMWLIEIESLKEFLVLSNKYGEIIIDSNHYLEYGCLPLLEIYDDYRE